MDLIIKLSKVFGLTLSNVAKSIEDYGAIAGDPAVEPSAEVMTANLNAIKNALAENHYVVIPAKTYWINGTIPITGGQHLQGSGSSNSALMLPANANYSAIEMKDCDGAKVGNFKIGYNDWLPQSYTSRIAVIFRNIVRQSEVHDIDVISVYKGFALDDTNTGIHNVFSVIFKNLKVFWYAENVMHFSPFNGGNTGCVFENIYAHNGDRSNRMPSTVTPFVFRKFTESVCLQINAEWSNVKNAFFLESNRNIVFVSTHIEGCDAVTVGDGLIHVVDGASHFLSLDINDIKFRSGGQNALFRVNYGGLLKVENLTENDSTIESGTVTGIISETVTRFNDRIEIQGARSNVTNNFNPTVNVNPNGIPKLIRYNDNYYWYQLGGKTVTYGTSAPTTGTWTVGDKVYNTDPKANGYTGWICTTAGTPGTWKGFGKIQA